MTTREGEEDLSTDRPPTTLFSDSITRNPNADSSDLTPTDTATGKQNNQQQQQVAGGRYQKRSPRDRELDISVSSSRSHSSNSVVTFDQNRRVSISEAQPPRDHEDLDVDLMHTPSRGSDHTATLNGPSTTNNTYSNTNRSVNRNEQTAGYTAASPTHANTNPNPLETHPISPASQTNTNMSSSPTNATRAVEDANRRVPDIIAPEPEPAQNGQHENGRAESTTATAAAGPPRATSPRNVLPRPALAAAAGGAAAGPPGATTAAAGYVNPHPNTTSSGRPRVPNSEIISRSIVAYAQPLKTRQAIILDSQWMSGKLSLRCFQPRHLCRNRCDIADHCLRFYNEEEDCCRCLVVERPNLFLCLLCSLDILTVGCPVGMCYHGCGTAAFGCWARWMVRRRYRIEGFGWSDCLMMMCCVGCATSQMQYEIDQNMTFALSPPSHADTEMR